MATYDTIKAASAPSAQALLEITGHVLAPYPEALAAWRRRMGVSESELVTTVRTYREGIDRGTRTLWPEVY